MPPKTPDQAARENGFTDAAEMQSYGEAMAESLATERWKDAGAPSPMEMWQQIDGVKPVDVIPLTVQQAAARLNVSEKWVRRRVDAWAAMDPPGAYRIGEGARSPWRIIPAALEREAAPVQPAPASPPRARKTAPRVKRSAGRWEV